MKRIIRYHRVSTKEQDDKGISLDAQDRKTDGYCKLTFDEQDIIVGVFSEDASGISLNRPKFTKVLELLRTGEANCLVCYDNDRLWRNPVDYAIIRDEFQRAGIDLHYVKRGRINLGDFGADIYEGINGRQAKK